MAVLTRFVIDLVTEEGISDRRTEIIARELTDNLHVVGVEQDDQALVHVDKLSKGHVHDTGEGDRCPHCVEMSLDYRNGDIVVANS